MKSFYDEFIHRILDRIYEEVQNVKYTTGEIDITIFLSVDLFIRVQASLDRLMLYNYADYESVKLFGCNVERYADKGLSFYVTAAKKIKY